MIAGTIVVDGFGLRPGIIQASICTALRLLEVNPLFSGGVPAGVIVGLSKTRQRWGDVAARTFVQRKTDLPRLLE